MIVGDTGTFAIESGMLQSYSRPSLRALGLFVIHVGGLRYGVSESAATLMANSFEEVRNRIARRGLHAAPFSDEPDLCWASDGDEAFDDGSYILPFDLRERVRLIAFKCGENGLHAPPSLRDVMDTGRRPLSHSASMARVL
jgi:hypothetical protein